MVHLTVWVVFTEVWGSQSNAAEDSSFLECLVQEEKARVLYSLILYFIVHVQLPAMHIVVWSSKRC